MDRGRVGDLIDRRNEEVPVKMEFPNQTEFGKSKTRFGITVKLGI